MTSLATDDDLADLAPPTHLQRHFSGSTDNTKDSIYDSSLNAGESSAIFSEGKPSLLSANAAATTPVKSDGPDDFSLRFRVGGIKDPGVDGKENQDDYTCWETEDGSTRIFMVLDGHGRELGKIASKAAKDALMGYLTLPNTLAALRKDAPGVMETAFATAHNAVRESFLKYYARQGMVTNVEEGGYIVKRHPSQQVWHCVHGGSTCSVCIILDNKILVSANVGDSSSLLCGLGEKLSETESCLFRTSEPEMHEEGPTPANRCVSVLTADHGPENPNEFIRMRSQCPCPKRGKAHPSMVFVYDGSARAKTDCNPVFSVGSEDSVTITNNGSYYKSVRNEWASLVTTPTYARFQDALAFTRSIGDLHLQVYGVSHRPDIAIYDLTNLFRQSTDQADKALLVMCSDGIWDNWKYNDAAAHLCNPALWEFPQEEIVTRLDGSSMDAEIQGNSSHTIDVAKEFMRVNKVHAHRNFGRHADNMCALICQIVKVPASSQ
jgi:serine/threonine protein phosphatase PrpC